MSWVEGRNSESATGWEFKCIVSSCALEIRNGKSENTFHVVVLNGLGALSSSAHYMHGIMAMCASTTVERTVERSSPIDRTVVGLGTCNEYDDEQEEEGPNYRGIQSLVQNSLIQ